MSATGKIKKIKAHTSGNNGYFGFIVPDNGRNGCDVYFDSQCLAHSSIVVSEGARVSFEYQTGFDAEKPRPRAKFKSITLL